MASEAGTTPCIERIKVAAIPAAVRLGRHFTRGVLKDWQVNQTVAEDTELIVTELVANAVRATTAVLEAAGAQDGPKPPVTIAVERDGDVVRISVEDISPESPVPQDADDNAEGGRGLFLVTALSVRWGICFMVDGKTVWAELALVPVPVP